MVEGAIVAVIVVIVMVLVGRLVYRFVTGEKKGGCPGGCHSPCCPIETARDPVRFCDGISCLPVMKHSDAKEIPTE